jgi:uncharacterized protein YmfQ (DUF2313 family)
MQYLPRYYEDFPVVRSMMGATSGEIERIDLTARDIFDQFFIDTATWSIARWEALYGIKTPADSTLSITDRRAAVKVQMQSKRVMSKQGIKDVFETFNGMEVAVTENNPAYSVQIKFTDLRGVPSNLPEIIAQMSNLLPAHLAVVYAYTWFLWSEWDNKNITWGALDGIGMTYAGLEVWA